MRFKDVCQKDLKTCRIQSAKLQVEVSNRTAWQAKVKEIIQSATRKENWREIKHITSRQQRTQPVLLTPPLPLTSDYTCSKCQRCCKSRVGLFNHSRHRRCSEIDSIEIISKDRSLP
ncbi:hypothetical protein ElyMa_005472600 [Elysia marginata]|uniref:C2H2-type domain-containing protein n=1 Tax=Elysia marginata TaxID=1093978 RepID=A0AAV4EPF1_9GAST|nr:hypothetical protein ElyMa_005472600 [Elysia marginata]